MWPFILILFPLPLLIRLFVPASKVSENGNRPDALRVPFFYHITKLGKSFHNASTLGITILLWLSWICLIIAAMRPVRYEDNVPLPQEARNIMLAIDVSTSMNRKDFEVNNKPISRIDVVKSVVRDFMVRRVGDRLGLVIFGTKAFTLSPLSQDMRSLDELFSEIGTDIAKLTGEKTAIGDALALAVQNTALVPIGKKVVILLSDGSNNSGNITVKQATELAKNQGVAVYTIGIGRSRTGGGNFFGLLDPETTYGWDERTLRNIADLTGGLYFQASNTRDLISVYRAIDKLETEPINGITLRPRKELFYYPLMVALFFWFLAQMKGRHR